MGIRKTEGLEEDRDECMKRMTRRTMTYAEISKPGPAVALALDIPLKFGARRKGLGIGFAPGAFAFLRGVGLEHSSPLARRFMRDVVFAFDSH